MINISTIARHTIAAASLCALALASAGLAGAAPPAGSSAGVTQLLTQLSGGYTSDDCTTVEPTGSQIARIGCARNHDEGGPFFATYSLYPNTSAMNADFKDILDSNTVVPFPDGTESPSDWYYNESNDVAGSSALITTSDGESKMLWTNLARKTLVAAIPFHGKAADLQTWWYREG